MPSASPPAPPTREGTIEEFWIFDFRFWIEEMNTKENRMLRIVCLDVNAREVGDSLLILAPGGKTMLIDAGMPGNGAEVVLPYLRAHGITVIPAIRMTITLAGFRKSFFPKM
jgi:beta-lactamase superfamily II metal-dependent hydrolase